MGKKKYSKDSLRNSGRSNIWPEVCPEVLCSVTSPYLFHAEVLPHGDTTERLRSRTLPELAKLKLLTAH